MATFRSYKQEETVNGIMNSNLTGDSAQILSSYNSTTSSTLAQDLQARGVYDKVDSGWDKAFSRIGIVDPYNTSANTYEYVFFTKPDLHIMEKVKYGIIMHGV